MRGLHAGWDRTHGSVGNAIRVACVSEQDQVSPLLAWSLMNTGYAWCKEAKLTGKRRAYEAVQIRDGLTTRQGDAPALGQLPDLLPFGSQRGCDLCVEHALVRRLLEDSQLTVRTCTK
jgi:hypothetical protein